MTVPLQGEALRRRVPALGDGDAKRRAADCSGQNAGYGFPRGRQGRIHHETHRCGGGLGHAGWPQKKDRAAGKVRPPVQTPRRRQVERFRLTPELQHDRSEARQAGRFAGNPQRIFRTAGLRHHEPSGRDAEKGGNPDGVWQARLVKDISRPDPQDRLAEFAGQTRAERHGQGSRQTGLPCLQRMDFRQRVEEQTSSQCDVEALGTSEEPHPPHSGPLPRLPHHDTCRADRTHAGKAHLIVQPAGEAAFDSGY